jgi:hypothetical protein
MGHDVVVIDRWLDPSNESLQGPFARFRLRMWLGAILRALAGCQNLPQLTRYRRTIRFVKKLGLTRYHFFDWKDAPEDLGVDLIVVGSDQVWRCGDGSDPRPYLLEGAPRTSAISYAASFGMKSLPTGYDYANGFKRFSAISVREDEGVPLVKGTGYKGDVRHVVDPTILLERNVWLEYKKPRRINRRLVCYFISEDLHKARALLEEWAAKHDWSVDMICVCYGKPFPKTVKALAHRVGEMSRGMCRRSQVRICTDYGPEEFVGSFADAQACVTDSFHAVMFSYIYNLDIRFLRPHDELRAKMFSRIEEFAESSLKGDCFSNDLQGALDSIAKGPAMSYVDDEIARRRKASRDWLQSILASLGKKI